MKALVTGAAGFLGRHIVEVLQKHKYEIVTVVRPTSDVSFLRERNVRMIDGDLRDPKVLAKAAKGVDVIVHAAAALRGRWEDFNEINVEATRHLLEIALQEKVQRFVFISSIIVYDHTSAKAGHTFREDMPYEEKQQTFYCKTKIAGEKLVQQYHEKGLATTIIRPGALYGKHGPMFMSRLGMPLGSNRYLIVGNGKLPLPLSHVETVAEAVWLAISKKEAIGQIYNAVESDTLTQREFFAQVRQHVKPKFSTIRVPLPVMNFMAICLDKLLGLAKMKSPLSLSQIRLWATPFFYSNEKIRTELNWQPADVPATVRDMLIWNKQKTQPKRNPPGNKINVAINSDKQVRVGVIGCGVISGPHLAALSRIKNAVVAAVSDPVETARETMAKKYSVMKSYSNYKEMLENEKLDAVHVCTPSQSHAEISIAAMNCGCHVFVEKPFALTAAEAKRMLASAKKNNVLLCVDHNHLFDEVMVKARAIIASGALGRVSYVESWYGTSYSSDAGSRYLTWEGRNNWAYNMPGSLYQNFISHPIALLLDVMGDARVHGVQGKFNRIVPHMKTDELRVMLENETMLGLLSMSMAVSPRYLFVNVYGTAATLKIDFLNKYVFLDKPAAKLPRVVSRSLSAMKQARIIFSSGMKNTVLGLLGKYNMYQGNETLIRLFYKSILDGDPLPIAPEEGVRSMEVMDEIWTKLATSNGASSLAKVPVKGKKTSMTKED